MPILIAIVGVIGTVLFFIIRARDAADASQELLNMGRDVRAAARRFGFRRRGNVHAVDSLEDQNTAIAALGLSYIELGGVNTQERQEKLDGALRKHLGVDPKTSEEMLVLGRWLNTECRTVNAAFTRLTKRLHKLGGVQAVQPLLAVLGELGDTNNLTEQQGEALHEVKRVFRL